MLDCKSEAIISGFFNDLLCEFDIFFMRKGVH